MASPKTPLDTKLASISKDKTDEAPLKIQAGRPLKLKEKQRLTMPLFSMAHTIRLNIQVIEDPKEAEFIVELPGKKDSKPTVMKVLNIDTGEIGLLIVNAIIGSALQRVEKPLIGKYFQLSARDIREGKKYRDIDVVEMEAE